MFETLTLTICKKCGKQIQVLPEWKDQTETCIACQKEKQNPNEIIIKHAELNIDNKDLIVKNTPKLLTLNEFVGQEENKKSILTTIKIIQQIKPINLFIHGYPGCGKSTLAEIIAHELKAKFIYTIPEQLKNMDKIEEILNNIQSHENLTVWMIDEAHNMDKKLINILLPILQDNRLGDITIRSFTMILATTDFNKLYKKSEALISRFQTKIYLEKYTLDNIVTILKQYKQKLSINIDIPEEDYILLAKNSKGIPREAINLLLKRLVLFNIPEILKESKIVLNGLNQKDIQILQCLNAETKPMGANFLSQKVGLIDADYQLVYEPFLVECGMIDRTPKGRIISLKGKHFLQELTNMKGVSNVNICQ